jgi:hypothetical protein
VYRKEYRVVELPGSTLPKGVAHESVTDWS